MSEFKKLQTQRADDYSSIGGRCKLCSAILQLDKSKIKDFYEALIDRHITNSTIVEVLGIWNITTSISTISLHRNGHQGTTKHLDLLKKAAEL